MSADQLTPKQMAFVRQYVHLGGTNGTAAAIAAGYSGGGKVKTAGAAVQAHRLLRDQRILAAIQAETQRHLNAQVALGSSVLVKLAQGAVSESVRLQAAQALLDRGGMQLASLSQHHVIVEDKRTEAELLARVAELQRDLGVTARPSALRAPEVSDAVEVVAPQGYTNARKAAK